MFDFKKLQNKLLKQQKKTEEQNSKSSKEQTNPDTSSADLTMNAQVDLSVLPVISSIDKCTMDKFETCILDENLKVLGDVPDNILQAAWLKIYSEYLNAMDDGRNKTHIATLAKIHYLSGKITMVKILCEGALKLGYHVYYEGLQAWGYTMEARDRDLPRIIASLKRDEMEMNMLIQNLPKQEGKKMDREYFTNMIIEFESMQHLSLEKSTLTVAKYCAYHKKLVKTIESKAKTATKGKA